MIEPTVISSITCVGSGSSSGTCRRQQPMPLRLFVHRFDSVGTAADRLRDERTTTSPESGGY